MISDVKGRVWKFGNNVDTDVICAGRFINSPLDEMKKHVFESTRPEFATDAKPGDIIVAGRWFGSGSSRETAPAAIKALGIGAVVAESFARNSRAPKPGMRAGRSARTTRPRPLFVCM